MSIKNLSKYGLLFLLPAIVLYFSCLLKISTGPYWQYPDPSYIYLLNSLNLVKGIPSTYIDHPGTPLQLLGQAVILAINMGQSTANQVRHVLIDPEFYLNAINAVINIFIFISSCLLGLYAFQKSKSMVAAMLSQLPNVLLLSLQSHIHHHPCIHVFYSNINDEPVLLAITNLFNLLVLNLFYSAQKSHENLAIAGLAFICGMGVASKLTFIPVLVLPLLLVRWPMKPVFALLTAASFVLWTLPFISLYPKLGAWIKELFTHTGFYGNGQQGVIDPHAYLDTWKIILKEFWPQVLLVLYALISGTVQWLKKKSTRADFFIWSIGLTILVQFLVIAKHYDEHYLAATLDSFGCLLVLVYMNLRFKPACLKIFTAILIASSVACSCFMTWENTISLKEYSKNIVSFDHMVHVKYPGSIIIGSYIEQPIRNAEYGLFMGNDSNGGGETEELMELYPDNFFFFTESRDIDGNCTYGLYNYKNPVWAEDLLKTYPSVIFVNSGYDFSQSPYLVKNIENGKYSNAYQLLGSTDKAANELFQAALDELKKGKLQEALFLALKSHDLHFQPAGKLAYLFSMIYPHLTRNSP